MIFKDVSNRLNLNRTYEFSMEVAEWLYTNGGLIVNIDNEHREK
jgi:hypothetical protein